VQIHYEGKWEGVGPWKSRLFWGPEKAGRKGWDGKGGKERARRKVW
jgi:hypothetical protein